MTGATDIKTFLRDIVGECDEKFMQIVVLNKRPGGGSKFIATRYFDADHVGDALAFAEEYRERFDVFVGGAPRDRDLGIEMGDASNVSGTYRLWLDADDDAALEALDAIGFTKIPAPTYVVKSGGTTASGRANLHLHWVLSGGIRAAKAEILLKALADRLKGDPQSADAFRILRLPGTSNFKSGTPMPVELVTA